MPVAAALPASAATPQVLSRAGAAESAGFEVYFPLRNKAGLQALLEAQVRPGAPQYHQWLTPAAFEARFGPTTDTIARVTAELRAHGFAVTERLAHGLRIAGTAAAVEAAFQVHLNHARFADGFETLVADRPLALTPALAAAGAGIPEFTTVPPMHKDSRIISSANSPVGPYFTADLRQAYDFPSVLAVNGKGVSIGILMTGNWNADDIFGYFIDEGAQDYTPTLNSIPVNGGAPFDVNNSVETHLDIEQSSGMALGANEVLYNLSDLLPQTVIYGLTRIVLDNTVDVVNMSFGAYEVVFLPANNGGIDNRYLMAIEDELFMQGSAQGITFVAASGDHGGDPKAGAKNVPTVTVWYPASDPFVTGVGGTNLVTAHVVGSNTSAYVSEQAFPNAETGGGVWGSGGGKSVIWPKPSYQKLVPTASATARTVPDLALHMGGCPSDHSQPCLATDSGDSITIGGGLLGVIGTSASAPDIAGMFALAVKLNGGRLGPMNTFIYQRSAAQIKNGGASFHHAAIHGNNGVYTVAPPYDLVIGNGTLDVRQFLEIAKLPAAGIPNTPSNP
jgi:subtilase family serine protease